MSKIPKILRTSYVHGPLSYRPSHPHPTNILSEIMTTLSRLIDAIVGDQVEEKIQQSATRFGKEAAECIMPCPAQESGMHPSSPYLIMFLSLNND